MASGAQMKLTLFALLLAALVCVTRGDQSYPQPPPPYYAQQAPFYGNSGSNYNYNDASAYNNDNSNSNNNYQQPSWGAAGTLQLRVLPSAYPDGIGTVMSGFSRPNPRVVSNIVSSQTVSIPNSRGLSDFMWFWGQMIDHDIVLTDSAEPPQPAPISVPPNDRFFVASQALSFNRARYHPATGIAGRPRQFINSGTSYLDAGIVYGSTVERSLALRTLDGTGRLKMSTDGRFLPFNVFGLENNNHGYNPTTLFVAGDKRVNETPSILAMQTLLAREHNRYASLILQQAGGLGFLSDDEIFERARNWVAALMQHITFNEYLPALLGPYAPCPYRGWAEDVDPSVWPEFAAAAFRIGHSMVSSVALMLDARGRPLPKGNLPMKFGFVRPSIILEADIDPLLRGAAAQVAQEIDPYVVEDLRSWLFGAPGSGHGGDLAATNIQRGRDLGLPTFNEARKYLGLPPAFTFADITCNQELQNRLAEAYSSPDEIDLWVGGLAEDHLPGASIGEVFATLIRDQFEAIRDGDPWWYELSLSPTELEEMRTTKLSDLIRRNTQIGAELQDNVFVVDEHKHKHHQHGQYHNNRQYAATSAPRRRPAPAY